MSGICAMRKQHDHVRFVFHPNGKPLGSGAYGTVYPAFDRVLNRNVAIKVIKPQTETALLCPTTIREIGLLKAVKHENIIALLDMNQEPRSSIIYLVFERAHYDLKKFWNKFYQKGLLQHAETADTVITLGLIQQIMVQMVSAISFLHSIKIIHRDIKPQNILLFISSMGDGGGHSYKVKLADFGLARGHNQPNLSLTTEVVTLWYRPIELLLGCKHYDESVDVWAVGCVLYELITNQPLFPATCQIETVFKIFQLRVLKTVHHDSCKHSKWTNIQTSDCLEPRLSLTGTAWSPSSITNQSSLSFAERHGPRNTTSSSIWI